MKITCIMQLSIWKMLFWVNRLISVKDCPCISGVSVRKFSCMYILFLICLLSRFAQLIKHILLFVFSPDDIRSLWAIPFNWETK
jgi:hypothetical protein